MPSNETLHWRWICLDHDNCAVAFGWEYGDPPRTEDHGFAIATVVTPWIVAGEECFGPWCGAHCGRSD